MGRGVALTSCLQIGRGSYQVASKVGSVYQVELPEEVLNFFKSLPMLGIDFGAALGPMECFGVGGFLQELSVALAMPVVIICGVIGLFVVKRLKKYLFELRYGTTPPLLQPGRRFAGALPSPRLRALVA